MPILEPYIQKEYLALKINFLKQQLAALPEVTKTKRTIHGEKREIFVVNSGGTYLTDSKAGVRIQKNILYREEILRELSRLEGLWNSAFKGPPPADIEPQKITRRFYTSTNEEVVIDSRFFNNLKHDANPYYPEHKTHFYNGTYYRSSAEADIARFYTEQNIPFKYEPEIWLKGMNRPTYTDFVILIRELDLCKFHEHFGLKNSADYTRKTATTYINYSGAALLPELDVFYTYDTDDVPFDLRTLSTKLNSVVYDSLFVPDIKSID